LCLETQAVAIKARLRERAPSAIENEVGGLAAQRKSWEVKETGILAPS
jgi:hypothetical protein